MTRLRPGSAAAGGIALLAGLVLVAFMLLVIGRSDASLALGSVTAKSIPLRSGDATLSSLSQALSSRGDGDALVQRSGAWELSGTIVVRRGASLTIQGEDLRLLSGSPMGAIEADGGDVKITDSTVTSWDPSRHAPDSVVADGRPWILAHDGARLDVRESTLSSLGYNAYGRYGVAWRTRAHGTVLGSTLDGNYFGLYTYQARAMLISHSVVSRSVQYGLDLHTGSDGFRILDNRFFGNGKHGLILAVDCTHAVIRDNLSYDNHEHGFVLFDGSNDALVESNEAFGNGASGLDVSGSRDATIQDNVFHENAVGLSMHDRASHLVLRHNRIAGNETDGVHLSSGARAIRMASNLVDFNRRAGVYVDDGSIDIGPGNRLDQNLDGLWLSSGADRISLRRSQVVENVNDGVYLTAGRAAVTIRGNLLQDNGKAAFSTSTAGAARRFLRDNHLAHNELATRVRR
jgi:parallel beta-helix repeat protein